MTAAGDAVVAKGLVSEQCGVCKRPFGYIGTLRFYVDQIGMYCCERCKPVLETLGHKARNAYVPGSETTKSRRVHVVILAGVIVVAIGFGAVVFFVYLNSH